MSSKSVEWEMSCSILTDRQTDGDMAKLIVAFRNFANSPKHPPVKAL